MASIIPGCCCDLAPVECLTDTCTIRTLRSRGGPTPSSHGIQYQDATDYGVPFNKGGTDPAFIGGIDSSAPGCNRLYVWDRRIVTGNVYGGAGAPDYILKTNRFAGIFGLPNQTPFETAVGSGILLDSEPYWWSTCHMGGWEDVGSMWYAITAATMDASRSLTLADGTYTMLAVIRFWHVRLLNIDGGDLLVPVTDGGVTLRSLHHIRYA